MSENTFRINPEEKENTNIFDRVGNFVKIDRLVEDGIPVKYLPKILLIMALVIVYVGNSHYSEKMIRKIGKLEVEVEDLRADFTTLKADYMYARLQSEVTKRVGEIGLEESSVPPYKIILKEGEY
jgi:hypothetical protein